MTLLGQVEILDPENGLFHDMFRTTPSLIQFMDIHFAPLLQERGFQQGFSTCPRGTGHFPRFRFRVGERVLLGVQF